jgi:hypothetical protein
LRTPLKYPIVYEYTDIPFSSPAVVQDARCEMQ